MSTVFGDMLTFGGGGSGGSNGIFAAIAVSYPSGSTCTATNGTTTLTASDTSGEYIFGIPEPTSTPETWTVSCTDGTDSSSKTVSITTYGQTEEVGLDYFVIGETLNDTTWENISKVSIAGTGDTYWDIGDRKAVKLNGTVGTLSLSNVTLYIFILDFNHPVNKTTADNNIIWGGFKSALTGGKDVALYDSFYNTNKTDGTKCFNMNHWGNYNYGGWKGCDFRYDVLGGVSTAPSNYGSAKTSSSKGNNATQSTISSPVTNTLMAALPSELRNVLRLWNRYIDYKGNGSTTNSGCSTATVDALSILAEFEITGSIEYANPYEKNHQKQMAYYANGNSKIKYKYNATSTAGPWLVASPDSDYTDEDFCKIAVDGTIGWTPAYTSLGLAPAFKT